MKSCSKKDCALKYLSLLANLGMLVFALWLYAEAYGPEKNLALLLFIPPVLSILAIFREPDLEERRLQKQVRKAQLRKALKELAEFVDEKK